LAKFCLFQKTVDLMMGSQEKYCLQWNDFTENITSTFGSLRGDEDFTDVTLACQDGHQVEAHKVILAASSPFFKNLLNKNKHPHPLIFMRGVKSEILTSIVDFLYFGEVTVEREAMESFLSIAKEMEIKGLDGPSSKDDKEPVQESIPTRTKREVVEEQEEAFTDTAEENEVSMENEVNMEWSDRAFNDFMNLTTDSAGNIDVKEQIKLMMGKGETMGKKQRNSLCKVCGKEGNWTNIRVHIENHHIRGLIQPCQVCEMTFRTREQMQKHVCGQND